MMTPEEARKAWVDALRSGEFKQGKSYLALAGRYCCLGVACELAIKDGVAVERTTCDHPLPGIVAYDGSDGLLPHAVQQWLGLVSANGEFDDWDDKYEGESLAELNDDGRRFKTIAKVIEAHPDLWTS